MKRLLFSAYLLLLLPAAGQADVAILVHGHLSSGETWARHGVLRTLAYSGWGYGGHLVGNRAIPQQAPRYASTVYTANLLSTAPLAQQAATLQQQLQAVQKRHPGEDISLVGHSAGGLVARLVLLMYGKQQITKLVTIATPNVGTPRARQGLEITEDDGVLESVKRLVGGNDYRGARQSRRLYMELLPWNRNSVLEWMNNQQHPDIDYVSVIRVPLPGIKGDSLVPAGSQDLNVVPALAGKASSYTTPGDHFLKPADGPLIARMLAK